MSLPLQINSARVYGSIAFARGADCAPARDPDCMALIATLPICSEAIAILKAWADGWARAANAYVSGVAQ